MSRTAGLYGMAGDQAATPGYGVMAGGWTNAKAPEPTGVYPRKGADESAKPFTIVDLNAAWGHKVSKPPGSAGLSAPPAPALILKRSVDTATGFVNYQAIKPKPAAAPAPAPAIAEFYAPSETTLVNQPPAGAASPSRGNISDADGGERYEVRVEHHGAGTADTVTVVRAQAGSPSTPNGGDGGEAIDPERQIGSILPVKRGRVELAFGSDDAGARGQSLVRVGTFSKAWPCRLPATRAGSGESAFRWKRRGKGADERLCLVDDTGLEYACGSRKGTGGSSTEIKGGSLSILIESIQKDRIEQILVAWVALSEYLYR